MLTRILARLTGQGLREDLAQVLHQQQLVLRGQTNLSRRLISILNRLATLENLMSDLDASTDDLVAAVNDLLAAVDPTTQADLLRQISDLNGKIATLQADDDADAAQIQQLVTERDTLLADSVENVSKLQDATARARAVVPAPVAPADPEVPGDGA